MVEARKEGAALTGVEVQSARHAQGLPATLPAWRRPRRECMRHKRLDGFAEGCGSDIGAGAAHGIKEFLRKWLR